MARSTSAKTDLQGHANSALSKLFGVSAGEVATSGFKLLPPAQIETGPQSRTSFPAHEITELADSISGLRVQGGGIDKTGILQPLLVVALPDPSSGEALYRLIAGERRLRASKQLALPHVPAVVLQGDASDETLILGMQIVENLQRRDLPPLEEARALRRLIDERELSIRDTAALLGKPKSYLSDRLALLKMGDDVQQLVSDRSDTLLHARLIDAIKDSALREELIELTRNGSGRRELESRIQTPASDPSNPPDADAVGSPTSKKLRRKEPGSKLSDRSDKSSPKPALLFEKVEELAKTLAEVAQPFKIQKTASLKPDDVAQLAQLLARVEDEISSLHQWIAATS